MKNLTMNHSAPVSSSKNFMQLTNCFFAGIFLCLGSLHSQTIDKTKPVGTIDGAANATAPAERLILYLLNYLLAAMARNQILA